MQRRKNGLLKKKIYLLFSYASLNNPRLSRAIARVIKSLIKDSAEISSRSNKFLQRIANKISISTGRERESELKRARNSRGALSNAMNNGGLIDHLYKAARRQSERNSVLETRSGFTEPLFVIRSRIAFRPIIRSIYQPVTFRNFYGNWFILKILTHATIYPRNCVPVPSLSDEFGRAPPTPRDYHR